MLEWRPPAKDSISIESRFDWDASMSFICEVIMPHSTRRRIALDLRKLRGKQLESPWEKHDNIPL